MATDLMIWCANNEPPAPAPGKDDFHMETVCTLVNIIGNAARSSVNVRSHVPSPIHCLTWRALSANPGHLVACNSFISVPLKCTSLVTSPLA